MISLRRLLSLPSPLLSLLITAPLITSAQVSGSHPDTPPDVHNLIKRGLEARERLASETPIGLKKMSSDPTEPFFLDYWIFPEQSDLTAPQSAIPLDRRASLPSLVDNSTLVDGYLPPFLLHSDDQPRDAWLGLRFSPRELFQKRDFQCPTNFTACTSINRPNSCCGANEVCSLIKDSGIGDVGCCPKGSSCAGSVGTCNVDQGYQSCPGSSNGGCCIPNYSCNGVGCAAGGTSTSQTVVVVTQTVTPGGTTVTSTSVPPPAPATTTSTITPTPTTTSVTSQPPSTSTTYTTLPASTATTTISAGSATSSQSSSSNSSSSMESTTMSTSTATAVAPVRPTSDRLSSTAPLVCPMNFYACSALYRPGCCPSGQGCDTSACPSSTTYTVVSSGATIVVPGVGAPSTAGAGTTTTVTSSSSSNDVSAAGFTSATTTAPGAARQGGCAPGWNTCAAAQGGGCCPTGYGCGDSCTATAGASPSQVGKGLTTSRAGRGVDEMGTVLLVVGAAGLGAGMLLL